LNTSTIFGSHNSNEDLTSDTVDAISEADTVTASFLICGVYELQVTA
jgi:hypothetical protein